MPMIPFESLVRDFILEFQKASAHGVEGIGIFAGNALEALYVGGDLSLDQVKAMTSGDPSQMV